MTFSIQVKKQNLLSFMRLIGYKPIENTTKGELNCVKPLGADYPRFHAYVKEENGSFVFNLHLDQKKPSYEGSSAHSGEYDGDTVTEERQRIELLAREANDEDENDRA